MHSDDSTASSATGISSSESTVSEHQRSAMCALKLLTVPEHVASADGEHSTK
jgi:hypothetical protein